MKTMNDPDTLTNQDTSGAALTFEQWASVERAMQGKSRDERLEVLEDRNIDQDDYLQAQAIHLMAIHDGLVAGDREKANAYRAALARDVSPNSGAPLGDHRTQALPFVTTLAPSADFQVMLDAHAGTVRQSGDTLDVKDPQNEPTLPFQFDASNLPSVEQYAVVCAELALDPDDAQQIKARHGLEGRRFESLERLFTKKFELQPDLLARYQRAYAAAYRQGKRS